MNHQDTAPDADRPAQGTRAAGIAITAATILSIAFVAMDSSADGATPLAILQSLIAMRATKATVHCVAIGSVLAYAFGYSTLASRLGLRRPLVLAGMTTYLIGCGAMIGATTMDGFISNDIASAFVTASPESVKMGYNIIAAIGIALTDFAKVGWVLQAGAAIAWSVVLLEERGLPRTIGLIGLLSGGLVVAGVFFAGANMSMPILLGILVAQAIWNLAAATLLVRSRGALRGPSREDAGARAGSVSPAVA